MPQPSVRPANQSASRAFNRFGLAKFTIGTKATNTIKVTVQLLNDLGQALTELVNCEMYLSDNADGSTLTATVPTSNLAIAALGFILGTLTTNKAVEIITNSSGTFDLNIIQTASPVTYYLTIIKPDGGLIVSPAITF